MRYRAGATKLRWQVFGAATLVLTIFAMLTLVVAILVNRSVEGQARGRYPGNIVGDVSRMMMRANLTTLSIAMLIALALSLWISFAMTGVFARSFEQMGQIAHVMASGSYDRRVEDPDLGPEIASLVDSFNGMAERLNETEASRRRMLTDLAHEMRTPIASIDLLLEGIEDGLVEVNQPTIDLLRQQCSRLRRLTDDVRDVSAAEEGRLDINPTRRDLRDIVSGVPTLYTERFRAKDIELSVAPPNSEPLPVEIDVDRIHQVITNLLNNALRHTGAGGHVWVTVDRQGDFARLRVTDDGEGIPEEHLNRVMERFYRVDTARSRGQGGTGVGLAICRAIAAHHHGSLTITSEGAGKGATGTLLIPLVGGGVP